MSPPDLVPAEVGIGTAICLIAPVSGDARGFCGFGSALMASDFFSVVSCAANGVLRQHRTTHGTREKRP